MNRFTFKLPDVGEGVAEAEIVAWRVAVGEQVAEDQPLADVMTDKATVELTSPVAGRVVERNGQEGEVVAVGAPLVVLETAAEAPFANEARPREMSPSEASPSQTLQSAPAPDRLGPGQGEPIEGAPVRPGEASRPAGEAASIAPGASPLAAKPEPWRRAAAAPAPAGPVLAAPAVRQRAQALGLDLAAIPGGGPDGRITHADLDAALIGAGAYAQRHGGETIKIIGLRRRIAERLQRSKQRIPHFAYIEAVDVTELEALRAELNRSHPDRPKLSLPPFLMRALVQALPDWPQINATFDDEAGVVTRHRAVHIGIATQTREGLLVPVVRHAEALDLWASAAEVARLAAAARGGGLGREALAGSTITLTSLGALGGLATTPVINPPEVAIIGPNRIVEQPVARAGQILVRKMMNLSSSFDHRVVDGYDAALFVQRLKALLEQPARLFLR